VTSISSPAHLAAQVPTQRRYGGTDEAVVGAQTLNFNSVSMGVSAIGNHEIATAPQAMTDAIKRVLAWKFSLAGVPATGTVLVNGKYLQRVSGHRDAFATDCPGPYLYARLPEIRTEASSLMYAKPHPRRSLQGVFSPGDFSGDHRSDLLGITAAGALYLYRGTGGLIRARTQIGSGWGVCL
jgi:hypothetical protein